MGKTFSFVNNAAKRAFLDLPKEIKLQFSTDLNAVQQGQPPFSDFKHLTTVGPGVIELIENGSPAYRALYCAKHMDTVFILHAFVKTTNGVDQSAMETAGARYKEMMSQVEEAKRAAKKFVKKRKS